MYLSIYEQRRIADRYSDSLYAHAAKHNSVSEVADELGQLALLAQNNDEFGQLCHSPLISQSDKVLAVQAVMQEAGASKIVTAFMGQLASNNRLNVLGAVVDSLQARIRKERGEVDADIITASQLSDKDEQSLKDALSKSLGAPVNATITVDESLIGGVKIRVNSRELDASVKGTLARAANRLYDSIQQA